MKCDFYNKVVSRPISLLANLLICVFSPLLVATYTHLYFFYPTNQSMFEKIGGFMIYNELAVPETAWVTSTILNIEHRNSL